MRRGTSPHRVAPVSSRIVQRFESIGDDPGDSLEIRLQKRVLVAVSALVGGLAVLWGGIYLWYDEPLAAAIPWVYSAAVTASLGVYAVTRRYRWFRFTQLFLIVVLPFLLQLALGGFVNASAVIIWSLLAPLGALAMSGRREARLWFAAYVGLVVAAQLIQPSLDISNNLPIWVVAAFFVMNIVATSGVAFVALHYFVGQKDRAFAMLDLEREKSDRLLLNVLPREIAELLKENDETIATRCPAITVLFADVVGFTPLSQGLSPEEVVNLLNDVFSFFDSLVDKYGLEKIRTIGDSYMVASGVPVPRDDHAQALARMALDMTGYVASVDTPSTPPLVFRIGISSGPAVAGVIGKAKFQYDVWGDTVNTASRMESHGVPGRIQLSEATYELVKDDFVVEPRGVVEVKGKGPMETWFLVGAR
jgi:guanylate cyclase